MPAVRTLGSNAQAYAPVVDASIELDREIGLRLDQAVARTEDSALAIMGQLRSLCDRSQLLSERLLDATREADSAELGIAGNIAELEQMAAFLGALPARLARDLEHIQGIADEMRSLSDLADTMRGVSMQSHLLSINAAIEASRAGPAGAAFKVVAEEMRGLAANSGEAATRIAASLERAHVLLKDGLEIGSEDATAKMQEIAAAAGTVQRLQQGIADSAACYRSRFAEFAEHGAAVTAGATDVLGQLQYQDVVRQCVERLQAAIAQRNLALQSGFGGQQAPDPAQLAELVARVLADYLAGEAMHGDGGTGSGAGAGLAIELF
jgi:methyl-accepting chemotaxis protein